MTLVQRFAQEFGAIYLVVGVAGFIPPLLAAKQPDSSFMGLLLGLFFIKVCPVFTNSLTPGERSTNLGEATRPLYVLSTSVPY